MIASIANIIILIITTNITIITIIAIITINGFILMNYEIGQTSLPLYSRNRDIISADHHSRRRSA